MVNTMVNYLIQRQIFIGKVQNFTIVLVNKIIKYHLFQSKKKQRQENNKRGQH